MRKAITVALLSGLGVATGIIAALVAGKPDSPHSIEWLNTPRSLANFSLQTEAGVLNNQSLHGRWTIVLFGFLHCADICPTGLIQMANLADKLAESPGAAEVAFVFFSVDPGRDNVADISRFVSYFNPSFIGATGSEAQLAGFAASLTIRFNLVRDTQQYSVAHSTAFSIIDPDGNFSGRFRPGFDVISVARDFSHRVKQHGHLASTR